MSVNAKAQRRKDAAKKIRKDRVITGYIEKNYPQIYKEAEGFYDTLNNAYPDKKDLRRTNEYACMGVGCLTINKRYSRTIIPKKKRVENNVNLKDNMVLDIPLLTKQNNKVIDMSQDSQIQVIVEPPQPVEEAIIEPPQPVEEAIVEPPQPVEEAIVEQPLFPIISDERIEEIIQDLKENDPDLQQLFNEIDIDIENVSPLESELLTW